MTKDREIGEIRQGVEGAERAADLLRALGNPHRLLILRLLRQTPRTVMDICDTLKLRQSLVSQHLARLRLDGIVTAAREGHYVRYSLNDGKAKMLLDAVDHVIDADRMAGSKIDAFGSRFQPAASR